jgi:predicted DNA-binding transcriptional regulator YafY
MTPELVDKAQRMYGSRRFTMAEIAASCAVTPMTIYRHIAWVVDNGSSHRGQAAIDRLTQRFPNAVMVHTPVHSSWLNMVVRHEAALAQRRLPKEVRLMPKV